MNVPEVAVRFRDAVRATVQSLCQHPFVGPHCPSGNPHLQNLRLWPVAGFEAIRIYHLPDEDAIRVIRILHGKRDVKRNLKREQAV
jgi:plasmid stabilization system protein ParE